MDQKVGRAIQNAPVGRDNPFRHLVWMIPSLLGPPVLLALVALPSAVAAVLTISWVVLSILATLVVLDWFRTTPSGITRHMLHVPVFLFGATSILIGVGFLAWTAYDALWERRPSSGLPVILVAMLTVISFGWYLVRLALGHRDAKPRLKKGSRGRRTPRRMKR